MCNFACREQTPNNFFKSLNHTWIMRLALFYLIIWCISVYVTLSSDPFTGVPVVYVLFGLPPLYMQVNIELALRNNPVVVITDSASQIHSDNGATYVDMNNYRGGGLKFEPQYKHMSKDISRGKRKYELQCLLRWYILRDYMVKNSVERVFFGDGDTAVFANMTQVFEKRSHCSATLNVEIQPNIHHWVAAGEASLWTLPAITSFCNFTHTMYESYYATLFEKYRLGSTVTDMSSLWFWWVANHQTSKEWDTGRPYQAHHCERNVDPNHCATLRSRFDAAFNFAKQLKIPQVYGNFTVCNGLDVVERTTFDHMHGWLSGNSFSFNFNTTGVPSFIGNNSIAGGRPETVDPVELARLEATPIELLTLHFQGNAKESLMYDLCRVLLLSGSKHIKSDTLNQRCSEIRAKDVSWPECKIHNSDLGNICV